MFTSKFDEAKSAMIDVEKTTEKSKGISVVLSEK